MREYLFKGFHPDQNGKTEITLNGEKIKGEWIYGYLINRTCISEYESINGIESFMRTRWVYPETVCEYTGLIDKNGKIIFEGDFVKLTPPKGNVYLTTPRNPQEDRILKIVFFDGMFALDMHKWWNYGTGMASLNGYEPERLETIGNIYDNPELLK